MKNKIRILVVGCGNMGAAHALAYHNLDEFEICGLVSKGNSKNVLNAKFDNIYPLFDDFETALKISKPDAVCISTYPDTHEEFATLAFEYNCHVFIEKPLADTVIGAEKLVNLAKKHNKKLVVGYILRVHPSWQKFIEISQSLGKPLVMRMNLNQQSQGEMWNVHKNLMKTISPIVDCGVHYIDVMCQMTGSKPVSVSAIGANLSNEISENNYNYGQLQIKFEDGSVGWYEAGWGPMVSDTAYFIKDIFGPKGSVSMVANSTARNSDNVDGHTKTDALKIHFSDIDSKNNFTKPDEWIDMANEPNHNELCEREQKYFLNAIINNTDLTQHLLDAVNSLKIVLACDESIKANKTIYFE